MTSSYCFLAEDHIQQLFISLSREVEAHDVSLASVSLFHLDDEASDLAR